MSSSVVPPRDLAGVGDRGGEAEHREQGAGGQRNHHRGGQAAPPAPADVPESDLRRTGQKAHAAQQPVAGVLAAGCRTGRFQRVPHRSPDGAPDRGQRGQRRPEQAHQRAGEHDGPVDAEADVGREQRRAEVAGQDVGEHDPEDDPGDGSQPAEQQRGLQVDRGDLPPAPADRLHDPDLGCLLGDQRCHRVRDQHQRRQQREQGDHVEEFGEVLEAGLAGPVARGLYLRQVGETGEAGDCGKRVTERRDRRIDRSRAGIGQREEQLVVAGGPAQRRHGRRRGVQHDHAVGGDGLAAVQVAALAADPQ